jgi:heptosyltransferase-1
MLQTRSPKVLIVRVGAMGDVLHGLPAVAALRKRLPECFIGWAIEPRWKDLLPAATRDGQVVVDRIHLVPTREWKQKPFSVGTLRQIAALRRELKAEEYDLCVDLQGSIRSATIGRMAEAKSYFGPRKPAERQAKAFYRERVDVSEEHVIDQACELVQAALRSWLGSEEKLQPAAITLPVNPEARDWCDLKLKELGIGADGFVLLSPAAGWGSKVWPAIKYRELAARLRAEGYRVLVNGGGLADLVVADAVAAGGDATVVRSSMAELIELIRRARVVIGGDSGPMHMAAALGRSVISLFGPTDPKRNGPYFPGSRVQVLRHATSRLSRARLSETEAGLSRIGVDEVLAAFAMLKEEHHDG